MAVMNQKALHKHAIPVIMLAASLLLASGLMFARLNSPSASNQSLSHLLNVRLFSFKPAANGFFHISRYRDANAQANLSSLGNQKNSLGSIEDAGRVAQIDAVVKGAR